MVRRALGRRWIVFCLAVVTAFGTTMLPRVASAQSERQIQDIAAHVQRVAGPGLIEVKTFYGDFMGDRAQDAVSFIYHDDGVADVLTVALFEAINGRMRFVRHVPGIRGFDPRDVAIGRSVITGITTVRGARTSFRINVREEAVGPDAGPAPLRAGAPPPYGVFTMDQPGADCGFPAGTGAVTIAPGSLSVEWGGDETIFSPVTVTGCDAEVCTLRGPRGLTWSTRWLPGSRMILRGRLSWNGPTERITLVLCRR